MFARLGLAVTNGQALAGITIHGRIEAPTIKLHSTGGILNRSRYKDLLLLNMCFTRGLDSFISPTLIILTMNKV